MRGARSTLEPVGRSGGLWAQCTSADAVVPEEIGTLFAILWYSKESCHFNVCNHNNLWRWLRFAIFFLGLFSSGLKQRQCGVVGALPLRYSVLVVGSNPVATNKYLIDRPWIVDQNFVKEMQNFCEVSRYKLSTLYNNEMPDWLVE